MTAPWIQRQLEALLAQRGHAWLLHGPSGLGQFELADALVRAWLCDQPTSQGACGQCASCHGIDVHTHPDLAALMPASPTKKRGFTLYVSNRIIKKDVREKYSAKVSSLADELEQSAVQVRRDFLAPFRADAAEADAAAANAARADAEARAAAAEREKQELQAQLSALQLQSMGSSSSTSFTSLVRLPAFRQ